VSWKPLSEPNSANTDWHSWKTRFLVKVDQLLSRTVREANRKFPGPNQRQWELPVSDSKQNRDLSSPAHVTTAEATIHRIWQAIRAIAGYLVEALLKPAPAAPILPEIVDIRDTNYHHVAVNYYYLMITLWYLVKHYPEVQWGWNWEHVLMKHGGIIGSHLATGRVHHLPWGHDASMKVKHAMLKWLHHESFLSLQVKWKAGNPDEGSAAETERSRYAARTELARRMSSTGPYRADDEIADRLAFLAEELWTDGEAQENATRLAARITKRIRDRKFTQTIRPCHSTLAKEGSTDGPWEIHALCHHSRLVVAHREMPRLRDDAARAEIEEEVEHFRRKLYPFLTSEASLTPCWERNTLSARRGFLRSEATAILASTIVDIVCKDLDYSRLPRGDKSKPASADREAICRVRSNGGLVSAETLRARQLETQEQLASTGGRGRQIDYLRFRPPRKYHPDEFFHSLDDTPELYATKAIKAKSERGPQAIHEQLFPDTDPRPQGRPRQNRQPRANVTGSSTPKAPPDRPLPKPQVQNGPQQQQEPMPASSIPSPPNSVTPSHKQDTDMEERTRELLQEILQDGSDDQTVEEALRDLTVIDLETRDSLSPMGPQFVHGADTINRISDSVG
jgi:hypothetical protein